MKSRRLLGKYRHLPAKFWNKLGQTRHSVVNGAKDRSKIILFAWPHKCVSHKVRGNWTKILNVRHISEQTRNRIIQSRIGLKVEEEKIQSSRKVGWLMSLVHRNAAENCKRGEGRLVPTGVKWIYAAERGLYLNFCLARCFCFTIRDWRAEK